MRLAGVGRGYVPAVFTNCSAEAFFLLALPAFFLRRCSGPDFTTLVNSLGPVSHVDLKTSEMGNADACYGGNMLAMAVMTSDESQDKHEGAGGTYPSGPLAFL